MSQKYLIIDKARDLNPRALSFLIELDLKHFPTPWSSADWHQLFSSGTRFLILSENGGEFNGFALLETVIADSFAHLLKIVIDPAFRGKKQGHNLLNEAIKELSSLGVKSFFLEVEDHNSCAIKLYESLGFKIIHHKKQFYSSGVGALIMTLEV